MKSGISLCDKPVLRSCLLVPLADLHSAISCSSWPDCVCCSFGQTSLYFQHPKDLEVPLYPLIATGIHWILIISLVPFSHHVHFEVQGLDFIQLLAAAFALVPDWKGAQHVNEANAVILKEGARTYIATMTECVQKRTGEGC